MTSGQTISCLLASQHSMVGDSTEPRASMPARPGSTLNSPSLSNAGDDRVVVSCSLSLYSEITAWHPVSGTCLFVKSGVPSCPGILQMGPVC